MKYLQIIFLSVMSLLATNCKKTPNDTTKTDGKKSLKVMTYNIHIANPPSQPANVVDLAAIANVINKEKPDFVALQEVDKFTDRSGKTLDQAAELGKLTNMNHVFIKAIDRSGGEYGLAILSKSPIEESETFSLPVNQGTGAELRALGLIKVKFDGIDLVFATTHLDHLENSNRELQSREILKNLKSYQKYPIILGGDFNMNQSNQVWNTLKTLFNVGCTTCPSTHSATNPTTAIDFLLLNNEASSVFKVKSYYTYPETYASDHLPVVMVLTY